MQFRGWPGYGSGNYRPSVGRSGPQRSEYAGWHSKVPNWDIQDVGPDAVCDARRGSLDGAPGQMRIARSRLNLRVAKQAADRRQALREFQRPGRVAPRADPSHGLRGQAATETLVRFYAAAPVHFYAAVDIAARELAA